MFRVPLGLLSGLASRGLNMSAHGSYSKLSNRILSRDPHNPYPSFGAPCSEKLGVFMKPMVQTVPNADPNIEILGYNGIRA